MTAYARSCIVAILVIALGALAVPAVAQDSARADTARRRPPRRDLPLEPTRHDSFTVSEGTWISLDVSPDGGTIVFDLLGDLYTLPIAGGTARRITSGPAFDAQPRYSPDGRAIVFTSDRSGAENLWLADADGTNPRAITRGDNALYASPDWAPDGEYVVASRVDGALGSRYELYLYHRDGGSGIEITRGEDQMNSMGPVFGPDGRYIWFARRTGGFSYNQVFPTWQLATYDRRTSQYRAMSGRWGSGMRPTLSPDGRWLVYATRDEGVETGLRLRDLTTGDEQWLLRVVQRDDQESRYTRDLMPGMSFTPDSRALVASYGGKIWRITVPGGQATEIPFTAPVVLDMGPRLQFATRITDSAITVRQIRNAVLASDGRRIAFTALDRLWTAELPADTAQKALARPPVRVTTDSLGEHTPAWSPDGQWLAWVTWTDSGGGHVWRLRLDGRSRPVRVSTAPAYYTHPVFTPDGTRLLVVRGPRYQRIEDQGGVGLELVSLPVTGGPASLITRVPRVSVAHFVRGEDDRIYYYEGGAAGLVSFRYDGTDRRQQARVTGYTPTGPPPGAQPAPASDVRMTPTGGRALVTTENLVHLVAIPWVGDSAPRISVTNPQSASVPVRRITNVAGDFLGWSPDGRTAYWSLGRFFFRYDVATGDSIARLAARDTTGGGRDTTQAQPPQQPDTAVAARDTARADTARARGPRYAAHRVEVVITVPRDIPRGTAVLRGARVVTMRGDEVIENGDIVVTDNRIAQVCSGRCPNVPAGARIVDVSGRTIIPGFVDIHAHPWASFGIHKGQPWNYLANLAYGVTTVRDPQTATTDVLSYSDMVEAGNILGPRVFHTGPGVFASDNPQNAEQTRDILRRYSDYYVTGTIKQYMVGNRRQRQWVIQAARELQLMPTTEGGLDFKMNLTLMLDGYPGLEHSLPITPLFQDVVQLTARSGITYTPTLLVNYGGPWTENYWYQSTNIHDDPKLRRFTPHAEIDARALRRPGWWAENQYYFRRLAEAARDIVRAGGRVGLGGHGQLEGLGDHWELWSLQSGGLTPHEVLRAGTIHGAEAIGLAQDVGSLEPGKLADLIVLDANPLDYIRNTNTIRYVMKNGRLYDGNTLDEIWPTARPLPRQWWMDER